MTKELTKITVTHKYAGYDIEIYENEVYENYGFIVKDKFDKIILISNRRYDYSEDAYIRACVRINEET